MIAPRKRKRDGRTVYDVKLSDSAGRSYTKTFETKAAAQAYEAKQRVDRAAGVWVDPKLGKTRFAEAASIWLAASAHKRPGSVALDRSVVNNHLNPVIGHYGLHPAGRDPGHGQQLDVA